MSGRRLLRGIAWLLIVIGIAPLFTWAAGGLLAAAAGCNYGGNRPCPFAGTDIAGVIETLGMTSLLLLVSVLPLVLGAILLAVSAIGQRGDRDG